MNLLQYRVTFTMSSHWQSTVANIVPAGRLFGYGSVYKDSHDFPNLHHHKMIPTAGGSEEYDTIFVGGGLIGSTGGCVTAGRLAAADPSLKILVLEAEPHIRDAPDHIQPARYFSYLVLAKETFTFHVGKPCKSIFRPSPIVPSEKCVGVGSGVNCTVLPLILNTELTLMHCQSSCI
ncbi:uncharacterized protein BT62DRAFT_415588 [Guyanagaster necrorhizus]|uniref:Glucose-methanol-choline oxidoreductase N-terminal domain-containing protein n=1 Tax=Guyanagaster necrorhizus TaxID=856835 RepID=A0A9P7W2Q1_9AGAR|nr:uncharacterized protein BT62DRAFT_415588 [Guyanagaster necrorhizus MCA 3950]KAG7451315.1 hypothetical protein BT62DRAFT_415588 [Guyanagaster necrorhizus MCA 3950]